MTKRSKIRANVLRGRLGEQTFSSRAKITPSLHLLRSEPKKRPAKKPLRKDPKKILKSKLIDEDSINLERSIKHLESGLNELNKNTSYRLSLSTLGSDKRRISSGTVGSLSSIHSDPKRKSLGNRISVSPISPSYSDTESSPLNKKSGLGINRRLSLVQHRVDLLEKGTLSHVQSIDDRVLDIEKRLKVIDMEQVKTRKEQTRTKERLDHVELEIGTQFKKQLEDIQLLTKTLEMVQNKQKDMSQSVKNYDKKQQDLDQVQVMLETKLHHHHEKMREFTERLEELSTKSREIAGNNHALREHLRLLPKESTSANWSRSHEAAAMHREETSANKIAAHKQTLRHLQEAQQQLVEERAARPPSKSSTPESKNNSSDELYKRYKNLKHAYYRVFGTAKR
jgi:DNA repair exonuclease SbcCD ATPase subunit